HAAAVGAEAARRAARIAAARIAVTPTVRPATGAASATAPAAATVAGGAAATAPGTAGRAAPGPGTDAGHEQSVRHIPDLPVDAHPELFLGRTNGFVDFSEDVSAKDLRAAVAEGYDSAELAKRFTTATMGPLQGKLEMVNTVAVVADAIGAAIAETGTTPGRPPYAPVSLAALPAPGFSPVRCSPIQPCPQPRRAATTAAVA